MRSNLLVSVFVLLLDPLSAAPARAEDPAASAPDVWTWLQRLSSGSGDLEEAPVECEPGWTPLSDFDGYSEVACARVELPASHPHGDAGARLYLMARGGEVFAAGFTQPVGSWQESREVAERLRRLLPDAYRCGPVRDGALRCVTGDSFVSITGLGRGRSARRAPQAGMLLIRDPVVFAEFRLAGRAVPASPAP